jgi:hypothetical protein
MTAKSITAWSYSRLSTWERCPLFAKAKFIDKLQEEPSEAMARGDRIHKALGAWLSGDEHGNRGGPLPEEAARFENMLNQLARLSETATLQTEQQWGFTNTWAPTGWFDKNTWLRSVLDVCVVYPDDTADVVDHKTGKMYDDNREQMELFGLSVLCRYPAVSSVNTRLWYVDSGNEVIDQFSRADAEPLKAKWSARAAAMLADREFLPKPNDKCKWCPLRHSAGGLCKFG